MHKIINNYIENLSTYIKKEFSSECIIDLKNHEVIIHRETLVSQKRALNFYSEKYEMQLFLNEENRLKGFKDLLTNIEKVNFEKQIRISSIVSSNAEYIIFEIEKEGMILGILKNQFGTLKKTEKHIKTLKH
ncbi:hypothetical protein [Aquimarina sediminis]|uniref:hypothetical protein n=1 Tax=Aquimarina sediminis TaxID=2070536 RepID=UPI000CA02552|nr:hypothetical protein [Aquimarina sediminis]